MFEKHVYIYAIHTKEQLHYTQNTNRFGYHVIPHANIVYMFVLGLASKQHVSANHFHLEETNIETTPTSLWSFCGRSILILLVPGEA